MHITDVVGLVQLCVCVFELTSTWFRTEHTDTQFSIYIFDSEPNLPFFLDPTIFSVIKHSPLFQ